MDEVNPVRHRLTDVARVSAYWLSAGVLATIMASHTMNGQWSGDAPAHASAITEMSSRPFDPQEPFVGGDSPSPYLSPWSQLWGLVARLTGWDAYPTMSLVALVNLALILLAFRLFVRELGFADRAAAIALVSAVVLWGYDPWRWSGFVNLNSLGFGLAYPSATCFALMLLIWVLVVRYLRSGSLVLMLGTVPLLAFVALSHPFTAFNTTLGIAALLVAYAASLGAVVSTAAAVLVSGLLAVVWPFYSLVEAVLAGDAYQFIHSTFYERGALLRLALLVVAIPPLVMRARGSRRDPLVWLTLLGLVAYLLGWIIDQSSLGRVIPLLVLGPQLAVAAALARLPDASSAGVWWRPWRGVAWTALALGFVACLPGLTRAIPSAILSDTQQEALRFRDLPGSRPVEAQAAPGDVVLVTSTDVARGLVAQGTRVVAAPYVQPLLVDATERSAATAVYASATSAERERIVARYDVDWVAVRRADGEWRLEPAPG